MAAILRRGLAGVPIALLMAIALSSCSAAPIAVEPTPPAPSTVAAPVTVNGAAINEQEAIAAALKYGANGDGHIGPAQESPRSTHAQLILADKDRDQLVAYGVSSNAADSLHGAVWLITLEGTWALNSPPQLPGTAAPRLEPLHHLVVVLDAGTGAVGFVSGSP